LTCKSFTPLTDGSTCKIILIHGNRLEKYNCKLLDVQSPNLDLKLNMDGLKSRNKHITIEYKLQLSNKL
jgi:hypothetical protein